MQQISFFNDLKDLSPFFWNKDQSIKLYNDFTPTVGHFFFKKSKKKPGEQKRIYLCLFKNNLIMSKTKEWLKSYKSLDLTKNFVTLTRLTGLNGAFRYGFKLSYNKKQIEILAKDSHEMDNFLYRLKKHVVQNDFKGRYELKDKLGAGSYAEVFVIEDKLTHTKYAGKVFNLDSLKSSQSSKAVIMNEIVIQRHMEHENIVKLHEVCEADNQVILIQELVEGRRLLDYVIQNSPLPEKKCIFLMKQLLEAAIYVHATGFMHRDLKLENIMITGEEEGNEKLQVKILDFGLAAQSDNSDFLKKSGTPGYVAPEVFAVETYNNKVDVFSLGVILYTMLCGKSPFVGPDRKTVLNLNRKCEYNMRGRAWTKISSNAKDLVSRMMEADPSKRYSCKEALEHPWFTLVYLNGVQPVINNPKFMVLSNQHIFASRQNSPNQLNSGNNTPSNNQKSATDRTFEQVKHTADARVASTLETGRSQSTRIFDIHRRNGIFQNQNLLQIPNHLHLQNPVSNAMLSSAGSNEEKTEVSSVDDGINKSSIKTFYKISLGSNQGSSAFELNMSEKKKTYGQSTTLDQEVAKENPDIKDIVITYKGGDSLKKGYPYGDSSMVAQMYVNAYGVPSLDGIPETKDDNKQSCDATFEGAIDCEAQIPKSGMVFKALNQEFRAILTGRRREIPV